MEDRRRDNIYTVKIFVVSFSSQSMGYDATQMELA